MVAQGTIIRNQLDKNTGSFFAVIKIDKNIDAPTVIYAKKVGKGIQWYPDGYDVKFYLDGNLIEN